MCILCDGAPATTLDHIDGIFMREVIQPRRDDRLGADILTAESQITVWVDPGTYDMQVEDEDGDTYTLWGVEVGEDGYTWNVTLADMD